MASVAARKRLTKEYKAIVENPPQFIIAKPNEDNILEWHYVIEGPPDTPYYGGQYHGTVVFPPEYPFKPPAIRMITPNGRFEENTRLCLSMSDYHPDSWQPSWGVATILTGLLSFMTGNDVTTGSITTSDEYKKKLVAKSKLWNAKQNRRFQIIFPELVEQNLKEIAEEEERLKQQATDKKKENASLAKLSYNSTTSIEDDLKEGAKKQLEKAANEKVINLDEIADPEDRIRAEEKLEKERNKNRNNEAKMSNSVNEKDSSKREINTYDKDNDKDSLKGFFNRFFSFLIITVGIAFLLKYLK
ncbi:related to Ubiquitin-conjugating enzyme E2 6 [Saccharomycodes ludwigii]|uniref:Ubiquitin-conjugating enzyme E2 6 n=1 Tax=Saccharomycodes ludwigii TaxID=36035 RepID=A0A376B2R1_9ASCO|nr:hypothetical protein SCDLUD_000178 [Saccharomycodes ludwigii]KAH3902598.1 hypothetical protein SCDLUD_000178 [Saccharomycodes ludwigii]SSD58965.1 related to Ubiquitin-conjugating enzyme E2 6 [Saccharomycodes ludwigii]